MSHRGIQPVMGGEDFSYMLEARPGAFIFIGNGDTAGLHNPAYDFNDEIIPHGMSYWVKLAETALGGLMPFAERAGRFAFGRLLAKRSEAAMCRAAWSRSSVG